MSEGKYRAAAVAGTATALAEGASSPVALDDQGRQLVVVTTSGGGAAGLALDATLTGGTQKAIVRGGAKGATTGADVTSTSAGTDHQALDITEALPAAYEDEGNGVAGVALKPVAGAAYGLTLLGSSSAANAGVLRSGVGHVKLFHASNANVAARYIVLVDKATTPTASDAALWWKQIPASTTSMSIGPNDIGAEGFYCAAGVAFAYSTGIDLTTTPGTPLVGTLGTAADHTAVGWGK